MFSAAKLFFAYGLGNGLTFPIAVGATAILMAKRPTPAAVFKRLREFKPTIFYAVPTLYAAMLASPDLPRPEEMNLRRCTSAGEALPEGLGKRWSAHFGVDILDGIGSTEMLHIFLSNHPDDIVYGTSGRAVPGYDMRLADENGKEVADGAVGELYVRSGHPLLYQSDLFVRYIDAPPTEHDATKTASEHFSGNQPQKYGQCTSTQSQFIHRSWPFELVLNFSGIRLCL